MSSSPEITIVVPVNKKTLVVHQDLNERRLRNERSKKEKQLILALIVLAILCFGLGAFIVVSGPLASLLVNKLNSDDFVGICDSPQCVEISHRALLSVNLSSSPCTDFFHYACSGWQEAQEMRDGELFHAANINLLREKVDVHIKKLLEKKGGENKGLHNFYNSCLNYKEKEQNLRKILGYIGGYKKVNEWSDENFNLTKLVIQFLKLNAAPLFDLTLDIDAKNRSKLALIIELPRPTSLVPNLFHRHPFTYFSELEHLFDLSGHNEAESVDLGQSALDRHLIYNMIKDRLEEKKLDELKRLVRKIGQLVNMSEEEIGSDAHDIALIAKRIEKLTPSERTRKFWKQQNRVYNEYSLSNLSSQFESIEWRFLFEDLLGTTATNFNVYVPYPDYLRRLFNALQYTNKRLLRNTMGILFVRDMFNDLEKEKKKGEERWNFCVHSAKSVFAMELSSLYYKSFNPNHIARLRGEVKEVFENVKGSLVKFLNRSSFGDEKQKNEALRKIRTLKGNFLAPSFYLQDDFIDDSIKSIEISPTDFVANIHTVYSTFREQLYRLYSKKVDEEKATWSFVTFPFVVNAFYIQQFNSIVIPLAFLSPPHLTLGAPMYVNYATVALTIAHEALHALDGSGSDFDAEGRLTHWGREGFLKEKAACVAKQYSDTFKKTVQFHQTQVSIQVDGNLTANENLADIAGLQVAFDAYKSRTREGKRPELKIPGLNSTLEQLFFLFVAQAYCANISPMGYIFLLEMDEHTPHPERMNGMLMNIPQFAKAFSCPDQTQMNPKHKCGF